ncbi:ABC transporter permease [Aestuariivirga sp.]|uniref:ABC transporter permease n=1 Tax=Aestuariivirga sp. TaxID=2650926 RepID=UPI003594314C
MSLSEQVPTRGLARFIYEVREGSRRQGNVIFALIFRELKSRSGQDGFGLLSLVGVMLEPAITVAAVALFWYLLKRQEIQGVHVILFLAVSMTPFAVIRRSLATIPRTIRTNRAFFAFPNVKPFDAVLARFLIEVVLTILGGGLLLFLIWWFLDLAIDISHFIQAMGIFMTLVGAGLGLSLFMGVYGILFPLLSKAISAFSRGLMFVSAVMHPASELPAEAQIVLAYNPLAHAMELLRFYTIGIKPFPAASFEYFGIFAASCLFMGFISYYANRHRMLEQ